MEQQVLNYSLQADVLEDIVGRLQRKEVDKYALKTELGRLIDMEGN